MGFFSKLFSKKSAPGNAPKPLPLSQAQLDCAVQIMRDRFCQPVVRISPIDDVVPSLTDSKFGGFGHWPANMPYPRTSEGDALLLLAQINFENEQLPCDALPRTGLLQFYIAASDSYGLRLSQGTQQDTFRVVFHATIDQSITMEDVLRAGAKANVQLDPQLDPFPFYKEFGLAFSLDEDHLNTCADNFDEELKRAIEEAANHTIEESLYKFLGAEAYAALCERISHDGSKMLGAPTFTQWDPRHEGDGFDTLLLQIDSEIKKGILWGDCGVANFFINSDDLRRRDFSRVLYNWDCY